MAASEAASRAAEVGVIWANPFARVDDPIVVDAHQKIGRLRREARMTLEHLGNFEKGLLIEFLLI